MNIDTLSNENYLQICQHIRLKRMSLRLPQSQVAFELGITQSLYSRIERGQQRLKNNQFLNLMRILGIDTEELPPSDEQVYTKDNEIAYLKGTVEFLREEVLHLRAQNIYI